MTRRHYTILFSAIAGVLAYAREWLVLLGLMSFPTETFFEGFPDVLSPIPAVVFVLAFLFRDYIFSAWAAFFLPSLLAHHANMLIGSGFFPMWPAMLGADAVMICGMLIVMIVGRLISRRYHVAVER